MGGRDPEGDIGGHDGAGDGGEPTGHDGVDLGEGELGQVGLDEEGRLGLPDEYVGGGVQGLTGRGSHRHLQGGSGFSPLMRHKGVVGGGMGLGVGGTFMDMVVIFYNNVLKKGSSV